MLVLIACVYEFIGQYSNIDNSKYLFVFLIEKLSGSKPLGAAFASYKLFFLI